MSDSLLRFPQCVALSERRAVRLHLGPNHREWRFGELGLKGPLCRRNGAPGHGLLRELQTQHRSLLR
jgi:hypothetical protein